jgi:hypothetical protein
VTANSYRRSSASPLRKGNLVLSLNGDGTNSGYVNLPPEIFNDLDEATVEGWVKWASFNHSPF